MNREKEMAVAAEDLRKFIESILGPDDYGHCAKVEKLAASILSKQAPEGKPCGKCGDSGTVFNDPMTDEPSSCRDCPPSPGKGE